VRSALCRRRGDEARPQGALALRRRHYVAPFLTIEGSEVVVWALGEQRFRVDSPDGSREVEGVEQARALAHRLAGP
jgi:hypothetical protein